MENLKFGFMRGNLMYHKKEKTWYVFDSAIDEKRVKVLNYKGILYKVKSPDDFIIPQLNEMTIKEFGYSPIFRLNEIEYVRNNRIDVTENGYSILYDKIRKIYIFRYFYTKNGQLFVRQYQIDYIHDIYNCYEQLFKTPYNVVLLSSNFVKKQKYKLN